MKNSYQFFQNRECEYFPCHVVEDVGTFNCLFCYCPLYLQEKCIGNASYILDAQGQKIKDCSNCTVPHHAENYNKILNKLQKKDMIVDIEIWQMKEKIINRMAELSSWDKMDEEMYEQHRCVAINAIKRVLHKNEKMGHMQVLLQVFSKECVKKGYFQFGNAHISCNLLERLSIDEVVEGYIYAFHSPEIDKTEIPSLLEQYYMENFQIACLDVGREWIREYLTRKHSVQTPKYCSPSFGPGYYGMDVDAVAKMMKLIDSEQIGIHWSDDKMTPMMSLTGIYLISNEKFEETYQDCESCLGQKGSCTFCQSNTIR